MMGNTCSSFNDDVFNQLWEEIAGEGGMELGAVCEAFQPEEKPLAAPVIEVPISDAVWV